VQLIFPSILEVTLKQRELFLITAIIYYRIYPTPAVVRELVYLTLLLTIG